MAHKRIRNNKFYYTVSNQLLPKSRIYLTFDEEVEGDAYIQQLEGLLTRGIVPKEFLHDKRAIMKVSDAIDQYIDNLDVPNSDQLILKVVRSRIGNQPISKLNHAWADKYVADMKLANLSPSTIRHHVGALARCLDWVKRKGDTLLDNPLRALPKRYASGHKEEFERDRRLSIEEEVEIRRIILGGKPKDKQRPFYLTDARKTLMLFNIAIETGMRLREIYTLDKTQIDLENRTIFLDKTKNGSKRQVPMTSKIYAELTEYLTTCDDELFGYKGAPKDISARLSQTFGRIFDAAGCADFTFHGLRHEATSRFYERTKLTDVEIAKILGWKSLRMALRYANLRGSNLSIKLW